MSGGDISKAVADSWLDTAKTYGCNTTPCSFDHRGTYKRGYIQDHTNMKSKTAEKTPDTSGRVYISGPMRGYEGFNYPAFNQAAEYLSKAGHGVLNPADNFDGATDLEFETYMRADLSMLLKATGIFMLKGWQNSEGARLELAVAKSLGLQVWYEGDDSEPVELEAARIVRNGAREHIYGHPSKDLGRTAQFWGVEPQAVALRMIQLKISRLMSTPHHRDSVVDLIGYGIVYARMMLEEVPSDGW